MSISTVNVHNVFYFLILPNNDNVSTLSIISIPNDELVISIIIISIYCSDVILTLYFSFIGFD